MNFVVLRSVSGEPPEQNGHVVSLNSQPLTAEKSSARTKDKNEIYKIQLSGVRDSLLMLAQPSTSDVSDKNSEHRQMIALVLM